MEPRIAGLLIAAVMAAGCARKTGSGDSNRRAKRASAPVANVAAPKAFTFISELTPSGASFSSLGSDAVLRLITAPPTAVSTLGSPPFSLHTGEGRELPLAGLEAKIVLEGPLAFTELHLAFRGVPSRELTGHFAVVLPPKAVVSRFAVKLPEGWQEAEVIERQPGGSAPAPFEVRDPNEFRARIALLPAGGHQEVKLAYAQPLESATVPYRLPLQGLPRLNQLRISVQLAGPAPVGRTALAREIARFERMGYQPDRDFELAPPDDRAVQGLRKGNQVAARFKPRLSVSRAPIKGLLLLVDTSASQAPRFAAHVQKVKELIAALVEEHGARVPLQVTCFDQALSTIFRGPLGEFSERQRQAIIARGAFGASDLHGALNWAWTTEGFDRLLVVTDGVLTAGKASPAELRATLRELRPRFARLDVVLMSAPRDPGLMSQLVRGVLDADGVVLDGELSARELAGRLGHVAVSGLEITAPRARWVWPSRLEGVQPGDRVLVFADVPPGNEPLELTVRGALEQRVRVPLATAQRPLLEQLWIHANLERLLAEHEAIAPAGQQRGQALRRQIVELSVHHRVLSALTTLQVLETAEAYQRCGLNRHALPPLLSIGPTGLALLARRENALPVRRPPVIGAAEDQQVMPVRSEAAAQTNGRGTGEERAANVARPPAGASCSAPQHDLPPARQGEAAVLERLQRHLEAPRDLLALVGLGEALQQLNYPVLAGRVFGSLVDQWPWRAEMRRFAGGHLERLGRSGLRLAADSYAEALRLEPAQLSSLRLLAHVLVRLGRVESAFRMLQAALQRARSRKPPLAAERTLRESLELVSAAWIRKEPDRRVEVLRLLRHAGGQLAEQPSLRFVLSWEATEGEADLHLSDGQGDRACLAHPALPSGGSLTGNAELRSFTIQGEPHAFPYRAWVVYAGRGSLDYGMGRLETIQHDGAGRLRWQEQPFAVKGDGVASVALGIMRKSLFAHAVMPAR